MRQSSSRSCKTRANGTSSFQRRRRLVYPPKINRSGYHGGVAPRGKLMQFVYRPRPSWHYGFGGGLGKGTHGIVASSCRGGSTTTNTRRSRRAIANDLIHNRLCRCHVLHGTRTNGLIANDANRCRWGQHRSKQARPEQQAQGGSVRQQTRQGRVSGIGRFGFLGRMQVFVQYIPAQPRGPPNQDARGGDGIDGPKAGHGQRGGSYAAVASGQAFGAFHQSLRGRQTGNAQGHAGGGRLGGVLRKQVVVQNVPSAPPKRGGTDTHANMSHQDPSGLSTKGGHDKMIMKQERFGFQQ